MLGVSLVSEYSYCPRSFAYRLIDFKPIEEENYYIIDGRIDHQRLEQKNLNYNRYGEREMREFQVLSQRFPVSGKIDRVVFRDNIKEIEIIEEKRGVKRDNNGQHNIQAKIYSFCLQEMYPDFKIKPRVYYSKSKRYRDIAWGELENIRIQEYLAMVFDKINNFDLNLFSQKLDQRCYGCMYLILCGER